MWNRIRTLVYKEFLAIWKDKRSRFVLIIPPLIQLFIFAVAATLDVKDVPIGIVNLDGGEQSIELVQRLQGSPFFSKVVHLQAEQEAVPFIEHRRGVMVLMIDAQFSRNLDAGKPANVFMVLDGRKSNTAQIVAGYASTIVDQFNDERPSRARLNPLNNRIIVRNWFNPNLLYYWYNVPCLSALLPMLIALVLTSLAIAREKELGTFDQLLVSPLQPFEILIGKAIPAVIIGMIEASVIVLVGIFFYEVPFRGSFLLLYVSLFVFICAMVGVGLFISSLVQTQQQAVLGTFVFMSPSVALSGFATPIETMPTWLQPITYLIPLRYHLIVAKGLFLKAIPAEVVFSQVWPMALIALGTLTASAWLFRSKLE